MNGIYLCFVNKYVLDGRYWYFKEFNPFPNKPWFLRVCSKSVLKTLWEKEQLLVTSNCSFSHSVFYPFEELSAIFVTLKIVLCTLFQFRGVKNLSCGKGLKEYFTCSWMDFTLLSIDFLSIYWFKFDQVICLN